MIDKEKGNLIKADRFGYVQRAMHGTNMLSNKAVRYGRLFNTIQLRSLCSLGSLILLFDLYG